MSQKNLEQALPRLDKLLEHRSRLAACLLIKREGTASFASLKELLKESDGNMGAHMRRLEDADYVSVKKTFHKRKPLSLYRLTAKGRSNLAEHLDALQALITQMDSSTLRS